MCSNAGFGDFVHFTGADLDLDPLTVAARHRRVDRTVAVSLGLTDVIFEPPRHSPPALVDRTQHAVAVRLCRSNDAETIDVGQARKAHVLFLHLAPNRIGLFRAAHDFGLNACFFQLDPHVSGDPGDDIASLAL